jgi:hypothetical protein
MNPETFAAFGRSGFGGPLCYQGAPGLGWAKPNLAC